MKTEGKIVLYRGNEQVAEGEGFILTVGDAWRGKIETPFDDEWSHAEFVLQGDGLSMDGGDRLKVSVVGYDVETRESGKSVKQVAVISFLGRHKSV